MQADFWHERWSKQQIGFHESVANPLLLAHFAALGVARGARIFLPLCGKTLDIDWLLAQGYGVAGAELSQIAVASLFERLQLVPHIEQLDDLERWSAAGLDVLIGDVFSLSAKTLGHMDAVYDRAALIALPPDMRARYAHHLDTITGGAPQLLITLDYDQSLLAGPPFSVGAEEIRSLYAHRKPVQIAGQEIPGGFRGLNQVHENTWLLGKRSPDPAY
ncbi:MAG: thiopurine S-methyltransferase [Pseudomonadota bacterium]